MDISPKMKKNVHFVTQGEFSKLFGLSHVSKVKRRANANPLWEKLCILKNELSLKKSRSRMGKMDLFCKMLMA